MSQGFRERKKNPSCSPEERGPFPRSLSLSRALSLPSSLRQRTAKLEILCRGQRKRNKEKQLLPVVKERERDGRDEEPETAVSSLFVSHSKAEKKTPSLSKLYSQPPPPPPPTPGGAGDGAGTAAAGGAGAA